MNRNAPAQEQWIWYRMVSLLTRLTMSGLAWHGSGNGAGSRRDIQALDCAAGPANLQRFGLFLKPQDRVAGILRPIASPKADLTGRAGLAPTRHEPYKSSNRLRVLRRALQMDTQAGLPAGVPVELRDAAVLSYREIKPAVMVEIAERGAARFTVYGKAALARRNGDKASTPVTPEPETATRILAAFRGAHAKEVLRQEQVFVPIPVEIAHRDAKHGRELGLDGQRSRLEVVTA